MNKKLFRPIIYIIILLGGISLLYFVLKKPEEKLSQPVKLRYIEIKVFDPTFIALEKGFLKEENLELELVGSAFGGPQAITALQSGSADVTTAAIITLINAVKNGVKVKGVADFQTLYKDAPLFEWFVLEDSPIKTVNDLRGRKIGVNTLNAAFHYTLANYLEKHGLNEKDVELVTIPHPNMEQALRSKQIDVAGMVDPFSEKAQAIGGILRLFTGVDAIGEREAVVVTFSESYLREQPEAVKAFIRAYNRAIEFLEKNPEEAKQIVSKATGVEPKYIPLHRYSFRARVSEESVKFWIDYMVKRGDIPKDTIKVSDIVTNNFN